MAETIKLTLGYKGTRYANRPVVEITEGTKVRNLRPLRIKPMFSAASAIRIPAGRVGTVTKIRSGLAHISFGGPDTFRTTFAGTHGSLFDLVEEA